MQNGETMPPYFSSIAFFGLKKLLLLHHANPLQVMITKAISFLLSYAPFFQENANLIGAV